MKHDDALSVARDLMADATELMSPLFQLAGKVACVTRLMQTEAEYAMRELLVDWMAEMIEEAHMVSFAEGETEVVTTTVELPRPEHRICIMLGDESVTFTMAEAFAALRRLMEAGR